MSYRRFVALGDSTTEGLMDPLPDGSDGSAAGRTGWPRRWPRTIPELRYANLAVRGKLARQVREEQLDVAIALEPDLVSVLTGLNDMLRKSVDVDAVIEQIDSWSASCATRGSTCCCSRCRTRCRSTRSRSPPRAALRHPQRGRPGDREPRAARSSSSSTRIPSPPTAGCGTRTGCTRTRRATSGSRWPPRDALGLPDADAVVDDRLRRPARPALPRVARGLVRPLLHAVADPAPARALVR